MYSRGIDRVSVFKYPAYVLFLLFLFASMFLQGAGQLRLVGIAFALVFLWSQLNPRTRVFFNDVPKGIWAYIFWIVVALFVGPMIVKSSAAFWGGMKAAIQSVIMVYMIYCASIKRRTCKEVWMVFLIAVSIHIGAVFLGYNMASERAGVQDANLRVSGLAGNENGLGDFIYLGVFAALMLWTAAKGVRQLLFRAALIAFMVISIIVGFRTGSRQTAIILLVMILAWLFYAAPILFRTGTARFAVRGLCILVIIIVGTMCIAYVMTETVVGARFQEFVDTREGFSNRDGSFLARLYLYEIGWKMFCEHPLFGVGFNQFLVNNGLGLFSHSDYMEPLACTGLIGFCLYHAYALGAFIRVLRLLFASKLLSQEEKYRCRMFFVFILLHYISGVFAPHWYKLQKVMVIAVIYAETDCLLQECRSRMAGRIITGELV